MNYDKESADYLYNFITSKTIQLDGNCIPRKIGDIHPLMFTKNNQTGNSGFVSHFPLAFTFKNFMDVWHIINNFNKESYVFEKDEYNTLLKEILLLFDIIKPHVTGVVCRMFMWTKVPRPLEAGFTENDVINRISFHLDRICVDDEITIKSSIIGAKLGGYLSKEKKEPISDLVITPYYFYELFIKNSNLKESYDNLKGRLRKASGIRRYNYLNLYETSYPITLDILRFVYPKSQSIDSLEMIERHLDIPDKNF